MSVPDPTATDWVPLSAGGGKAWMTGDTKISLAAASHDDPAGGRWLLADGSAIPAQYTDLITMAGPNLPDAKGRSLVMLGTHADVNALSKNDGQALPNRSPKHKSSVAETPHTHRAATLMPEGGGDNSAWGGPVTTNATATTTTPVATGLTVGPQASAMIDTGSFVVVGNLFVHT